MSAARPLASQRAHVWHSGRRIKFITAMLCDGPDYEPRLFVYRLPDNDPRRTTWPRGSQSFSSWYALLPVGIWCEIA
ncbi:MAG: hypothetical protein H6948_01090 [Zoogloeaceae bacterium]|nr:hypothetical protein [Zoogloeaceae bacterium]